MIQKGLLLASLKGAGFKHPGDIILAFTGGSRQHGAYGEDSGDLDIFGVFVERPSKILGLQLEEHFVTSTSDNSSKNTSADEDYKIYGLRHWASQAAKGNPTALGFLFCPTDITDPATNDDSNNPWLSTILPNRELFLASSHTGAFIGYARGQLERLQGRSTGKHGQRPELIEKYGYDTKAAMHMIRMGYECQELLMKGYITYPRPEKNLLIAIRQGRYELETVEGLYHNLVIAIRAAEQASELPVRVNYQKISNLIADAYLKHWVSKGIITEAICRKGRSGWRE